MEYAIKTAVVIGSGTMGSAIAAHIANAGLSVTLLDIVPGKLTEKEKNQGLTLKDKSVRNRIVNDSWAACKKSKPPAFYSKFNADRVVTGNLDDNFDSISKADWIVEVIVENLEIKKSLMSKIEKVRKSTSIISSNTSGLTIESIATGLSKEFKQHFLGTHFFNPPRYMKLLEVIPGKETSEDVLIFMKEFCESVLGKVVVFCKDTPNFIANRYISFSGINIMSTAIKAGLSVSDVDALTGQLLGRPKTATYRLFDLIGNDIVDHVNKNLYEAIPDDPYRESLKDKKTDDVFKAVMDKGLLGNKTKKGFYKVVKDESGKKFFQLNFDTMEYTEVVRGKGPDVKKYEEIKSTKDRIKAICKDAWSDKDNIHAKFMWETMAFTMNYSAWVMPEITEDLYSFDNAIKMGFAHEFGPFELWDALGFDESVKHIKAMGLEIPEWVSEMLSGGNKSFYKTKQGKISFYDPSSKSYSSVPEDPRKLKLAVIKEDAKNIVATNDAASLVDIGDKVLCLEFHSKGNSLTYDHVESLDVAIKQLEENDWIGLVIGNDGKNFCAGADLRLFTDFINNKDWDGIDKLIETFQKQVLSFRKSTKPVVAAAFGMVVGGGSELMLESSAICAHAESYIGQIEPVVGVIPALGGCKELLRRVLSPVMRRTPDANPYPILDHIFKLIAMNQVSNSAPEARDWGFLQPSDRVVMNRDYLLSSAKKMVQDMVDYDYTPEPTKNDIYVLGAAGYAHLEVFIYNMREAGWISDHDVLIVSKLAYVLCGGMLSEAQWVDSQYILDLEREAFVSLLAEEKTGERVQSILTTGKYLRN